jgi:hypothetical protein
LSVKVDALRVGLAPRVTNSRAFAFVPGNMTLAVNPTGAAATSMAVLMGVSSKARIDVSPPLKTDWLATDAAFRLQDNCNRAGIDVKADTNGGQVDRVRIGILSNEQGDCVTPDSFIGIGTDLSGSQVVGNRNLDGNPVNLRHGAVLVRSNDLTDATVGTRVSCAAHEAAGFVVDGFYLVGGVRTFCDQP